MKTLKLSDGAYEELRRLVKEHDRLTVSEPIDGMTDGEVVQARYRNAFFIACEMSCTLIENGEV
jgi:hypothetical protein